jgi:hypothetical protein
MVNAVQGARQAAMYGYEQRAGSLVVGVQSMMEQRWYCVC